MTDDFVRSRDRSASRMADVPTSGTFQEVYRELRGLAGAYLRRERAGHTLQPTALVNEAVLRLLGDRAPWEDRARFVASASVAMRRVLVDHARRRLAHKRSACRVEGLDPDTRAADDRLAAVDVLALDEALERLRALDERKAKVVELRYFAGLGNEAIADLLGVARSTVAADWRFSRSWLAVHLRPWEDEAGGDEDG